MVTTDAGSDAQWTGTGDFSCNNAGVLHDGNGTKVVDFETVCMEDALWRDELNVECWTCLLLSIIIDIVLKKYYIFGNLSFI